MTKRTGRVSAVVLGLISGIILFIHSFVLAMVAFIGGGALGYLSGYLGRYFSGYFYGASAIVGIIIFVVGLLSMLGGCLVRRSRITGGVFMMITSIPIIIISAASAWAFGYMYFILLLGILSLVASILAFIPYSDSHIQQYIQRKQGAQYRQQPQYQQPYQQQPYQQPYQQPQYQQPYQQPQAPQQPYQQPQYQPQPQQQPQAPPAPQPPEDKTAQ